MTLKVNYGYFSTVGGIAGNVPVELRKIPYVIHPDCLSLNHTFGGFSFHYIELFDTLNLTFHPKV